MKPIRKLKLLFNLFIIYSCTSGEYPSQSPQLNFIGDRAKESMQEGEVVTFHMLYKNRHDQVIADTHMMGGPVSIVRNDSIWQKSGMFYQALQQMGKGDSANFVIPAKDFYEKSGEALPGILGEDDSLYFQVKILSIK